MSKKIVLVTGGSSGIGKICSEYLSKSNYIVYGTTRRKIKYNEIDDKSNQFTLITLDVTKKETIKDAINYIIEKHKKIDILVNNAGFGIAGSTEDTSYEEILMQFNVNFFGLINVTNSILPIFRKQGYGQIINIGSVAGYVSLPFQGMYSSCKAALLSYSKTLRNEIRPFNIKVTIIEPGDIKTGFTENRVTSNKSNNQSVYIDRMRKSIKVMENDEKNGGNPIIIAKAIKKVIDRKNPPIAITVGFKYKIFKLLFRILPNRLTEYIIYQIYGK